VLLGQRDDALGQLAAAGGDDARRDAASAS
jgi:hypothetical protein